MIDREFFLIPVDSQIYYNKTNMILSCTDMYHDCGSIMQSGVSMSALMKSLQEHQY